MTDTHVPPRITAKRLALVGIALYATAYIGLLIHGIGSAL